MKLGEIPSRIPAAGRVLLGRNRQGTWVARDQNGSFGGLFVNRAQALKYARSIGQVSGGIVELAEEIELDIF
ncbi:hypothetical protein [Bradyrhizobium canariense]|uniref:hypothetical protein n=1 Tax=Bradyrhizobium canariense TaxID=255045 RepID=UPI000A192433|nr:hypothetical protein [Bradyrhizobium canariense]OSI34909.1 hypothetical protein BST65_01445 [Bradyrhizobium canariense]OSI38948.1 hypothetical protein BST66_01950 [Bradyrhizobium canariense]OSI54539.1 hypothetical protein BSZ20_02360 [Bradyrhizobium canariense]OSI57072.1 hypothetical protein BST67_02325 [Bradyrhizobium canariense]OSI59855.1 hypothetical protein BSZ15_02585 [Bradyrhizobium canariense]